MDELFLHMFEQFGDVTFLLLLCGYKGNGKTLRTERAEACFPLNWVTTGGPSSAKAGQNGQSDAQNGKNVIYDEMVDELCDAEGSDRLGAFRCSPLCPPVLLTPLSRIFRVLEADRIGLLR